MILIQSHSFYLPQKKDKSIIKGKKKDIYKLCPFNLIKCDNERTYFGRQKHEIKETLFHVKSDDSINHHIYLMKKENKKISNLSAWQRQNNNVTDSFMEVL